jgi:hypothetical protein
MFLRSPLIKPNFARRYMSSSNNEIDDKLDIILNRTKSIIDMQFAIFIVGMSTYIIEIARSFSGK